MWYGGGYTVVKRPTHVSEGRLRAMNLYLQNHKDDFEALEEIEPLIPEVLEIERDCFLYPIGVTRKEWA